MPNKFHFVERVEIAQVFLKSLANKSNRFYNEVLENAIIKSNVILIDSALEKELTLLPQTMIAGQSHPLDLPFETCWFELTNSEPEFYTYTGAVERRVGAIVASEGAFNKYAFICYEVYPARVMRILTDTSEGADLRRYYEIKEWVRLACEVLNKETNEVGQDHIMMSSKLKGKFSGNTKVRMRNTPITIVVPKAKERRTYVGSKQLDFSHRFEVRGHWRKTTGVLGKNREGEYVVQGYTWVKAHIKGPEDKPVVKKTRIIKGEINA